MEYHTYYGYVAVVEGDASRQCWMSVLLVFTIPSFNQDLHRCVLENKSRISRTRHRESG